ncbi:MAG TPA: radical SAM family heme chaperone HemW [Chthoniobacterales bacterium]|jgi:oxygen-independent coproporphyrinogen-3 oxidase
MTTSAADTIQHIYVHIPFCARICPYCAFYKELLDRAQTQRFCEALLGELEQHAQDQPTFAKLTAGRHLLPSTIYLGGGTPSALTTRQLEFLLKGFRDRLDLSELREWTLEANPGSVSARKASLLKELSVNRISLGVQSWDEDLLKLLGREHNAPQAEESFWILRDAGFTNINIDLMFGLPGQTTEQWRKTLERTIALAPEHVSTYCLTYEEDTEFFQRHARGEFQSDVDGEAELFEMTMSILQEAGYVHYEISNYARPGFESLHNRAYWAGEDYLGIGPSAFSTVAMQRWQNVCDYRIYAERVLSGRSPIATVENLTAEMKRCERVALDLRTRDGVPAELLMANAEQVRDIVTLGLLRRANNKFALTGKGKLLADSVAEAFF